MSSSSIHPAVVARSLPEANDELHTLGPRTAVVSIAEPGAPTPYGFKPHNPLHLRLEFHDVTEAIFDEPGIVPPGAGHVRLLLERARILRTAQLVYCHCNAGISRSTAAAFILHCLWLGPGREADALRMVLADRPQASPNRTLVALADDLMERGGAMVEVLR